MAERICEVLVDKRGHHWHTHEAPEPEDPAAEVVRLKNAVTAEKRKASALAKALTGAEKKVKAAAPVVADARNSQRQSTSGSKRRREIDSACTDKFDRANKSTAMTAADTGAELASVRRLRVVDVLSSVNVAVVSPLLLLQSLVPAMPPVSMHCTHQCVDTGVNDTLKYWCQCSQEKLLQMIMAQIEAFGLREEVSGQLGLTLNKKQQRDVETNAHIVRIAADALAILKQCRTETQRLQYRLAMTVLAPTAGEWRNRVAKALEVPIFKPYKESIKKRAAINVAAVNRDAPLVVGDAVLCRHGEGILTEYTDHDSACSVKITHGDHVHTSEFTNAGKDIGGGRIQRVPIDFAHDPRAERSDALCAVVKEKVSGWLLLCTMAVDAVLTRACIVAAAVCNLCYAS
jgi:hypothetical protein